MSTRKKAAITANVTLTVLILLGVLAIVNYAAAGRFMRLDLTENDEYTISEATRRIIEGLDDVVNVKVFFSHRLPPTMVNLENQIHDLLEELQAYSGGNLEVEYIDPGDDEELQRLAQSFAIPQVQLNIFEKDKAEVTNAYMGIGILYADKKESIPIVESVGNLEYDLASALVKVTRGEVKTIGFLVGHDEHDIYADEDYGIIRKELDKEYRTTMVDLSKGGEFPPGVSTLVVAGPKKILKEREKFEIDQYLMQGGRAIFLIDPIRMNPGLQGVPQPTNLDDLLAHYGVRVSRDLVIDSLNSMASFSRGYIRYSVPYPFWPLVHKANFSRQNPVVNKLEGLTLPWCGPLTLLTAEVEEAGAPAKAGAEGEEDAGGEEGDSGEEAAGTKVAGIKGTVLFTSTEFGAQLKAPFNLNPQQAFKPEETRKIPLAVVLSGRFASFYKGREVPKKLTGEEEEGAMPPLPEPGAEAGPQEPILEESPETQIIVVGNAEFAKSNFLGQFPHNGIFLLNCIDWLTQGEDLIGIRTRSALFRPLEQISDKAKATYRFLNNFGVSALVIAFGAVWFALRRRRKPRYAVGPRREGQGS